MARLDFAAKGALSQGRTLNSHSGKRLNAFDRGVSRTGKGKHVSVLNHDLIASPQAIDDERAVLGIALQDESSLDAVREILKPSDFLDPCHSNAYAAMLELRDRKSVV